jgi:hypothetical protein
MANGIKYYSGRIPACGFLRRLPDIYKSVNKANYAVKMYQKLNFEIVEENEQDYLMVLKSK